MAIMTMNFPEAWQFVRMTKLEDHHFKCSWRSGMICDCNVLWAEYYKRRVSILRHENDELRGVLQRIVSDFECDYVLDGVVVDNPTTTHQMAWELARAALASPAKQGATKEESEPNA